MRPLVSYDDITSQTPVQVSPPQQNSSGSPPKKRRKNNHRQGQWQGSNRGQYYNGDYEKEGMDPPKSKKARRDYGLKEESRQLTHEEVWDDSALIHAWDAAVEEYEVLNGPDKKWKIEPVNKSALWFNIPVEREEHQESSVSGPSFLVPSIPDAFASQGGPAGDQDEECSDLDNSRPIDFETYVPRHDPSLSHATGIGAESTGDKTNTWRGVIPPVPTVVAGQVTKDQAFEHAIGAWYWAGYWTGVYHSTGPSKTAHPSQTCHDNEDNECSGAAAVDLEQEVVAGEEVRDEAEDLIPT